MRPFGKDSKQVRVLFLLVDVEDPQSSLTELHKITIENKYVLVLSWRYARVHSFLGVGTLNSIWFFSFSFSFHLIYFSYNHKARRSVADTLKPSKFTKTGRQTC